MLDRPAERCAGAGATRSVSPRSSLAAPVDRWHPPSRQLTEFPTFSDWPAALARHQARRREGRERFGVLDTVRRPGLVAKPDPGVLEQVFGDKVGVVDHEFTDQSEKGVTEFPATEVANDLLAPYAAVATANPTAFPPVTSGPLAGLADDLGSLGDARRRCTAARRAARCRAELGPRRPRMAATLPARRSPRSGRRATTPWPSGSTTGTGPASGSAPRRGRRSRPPSARSSGRSTSTDTSRCSATIRVAAPARPRGRPARKGTVQPPGKAEGRLRVEFDRAPVDWFDKPRQHAVDPSRSSPAGGSSRSANGPGELVPGQLRLESERFRVHQIDVDGSVLKGNAASSLLTVKSTIKESPSPR